MAEVENCVSSITLKLVNNYIWFIYNASLSWAFPEKINIYRILFNVRKPILLLADTVEIHNEILSNRVPLLIEEAEVFPPMEEIRNAVFDTPYWLQELLTYV